MYFMTGFLMSTNWKGDNYDLILVIVDRLIKMVYYESIKITINILDPVKVMINVVVYHYKVFESIVTN